jgi:hypothetical protein
MMRTDTLLSISFDVILAPISKVALHVHDPTLPLLVVMFQDMGHEIHTVSRALIHSLPRLLACESEFFRSTLDQLSRL